MSPQLKELSPQIDILNKIKNGELFTKDEIKEITEMLKRSSEQIKDKKIRVIFENILDVLGTIEKDQVLTTQEKHIIDENIGKIIGKKQDGELFKEIIEMLKNLGGQIEDKKIRVVFKNILDVLMTIEKDQVLEKAVIDKKNKISLSYFTPRRGRSRSRSRRADDVAKEDEECFICHEEYNTTTHAPTPLTCDTRHTFCKECVVKMTEPSGEIKCPLCRQRSKSPAGPRRPPPASARCKRTASSTKKSTKTTFNTRYNHYDSWILS